MSSHLFPVKKTGGLISKFLDIGNHINIKSAGACEHNEIIYFLISYDHYIEIQSFNVHENLFLKITNIDTGSINLSVTGILSDGDNIYVCGNNGSYTSDIFMMIINIYDISENINIEDVLMINIPSSIIPDVPSNIYESIQKIDWVNDATIVIPHSKGFYFFDTISNTWSSKMNSSTFYSRSYLSVGKNSIMSHWGDNRKITGDSRYPTLFDMNTNTFDVINLPSPNSQVSLFLKGNYYIAQSNYVHIFSESDRVIKNSLPVPISDPSSISYMNERLLFTQKNSDILFIYDLSTEMYKQVRLPWSIPTLGTSYFHSLIQPTVYRNSLYIPYITLGIINIDDIEIYKFGVIK